MNTLIVLRGSRRPGGLDDGMFQIVAGAAEFGHVRVVVARGSVGGLPSGGDLATTRLTSPRLPEAEMYSTDCGMLATIRAALTTLDWRGNIDLVILGVARGGRRRPAPGRSEQGRAALTARSSGLTSYSLALGPGRPAQFEVLRYVVERLMRSSAGMPSGLALHLDVPNVRPNELDGFCVGSAGKARLAAVLPMAEGKADVADMEKLRTAVGSLGSPRAHREAAQHGETSDVAYEYHFRPAVMAPTGGHVRWHQASLQATEIDPVIEAPILTEARGRVLDIGCGSGRIAVHLATRRASEVTEVVGVDSNPMSLVDYRRRWASEDAGPCVTRCLDVRSDRLTALGRFDTFLLFGDTLGIARDWEGAQRLLRKLRRQANAGTRICLTSRDPGQMTDTAERQANAANLRAGLGVGQRYLRISFGRHDTGWFPWYYVGVEDLRLVALASGWRLTTDVTEETGRYGAVLHAAGRPRRGAASIAETSRG